MADATMRIDWYVKLTNSEFTLVLKALGGRLTDEESRREAQALGDQLTVTKVKEARQRMNTLEKLERSIPTLLPK